MPIQLRYVEVDSIRNQDTEEVGYKLFFNEKKQKFIVVSRFFLVRVSIENEMVLKTFLKKVIKWVKAAYGNNSRSKKSKKNF